MNACMRSCAAVAEAGKVCDFGKAAGPIAPLLPIDVASNVGAAANSLPGAFRALYNNPSADIDKLFTIPKNCPTHAVRDKLLHALSWPSSCRPSSCM